MEIIIFQLLSCLYFYDSRIEVPVCIKKSSRSTVYQPECSYTVLSVNRLPAGAFIHRAVGQQTLSSVGSLRKVGRSSPGVQRVKKHIQTYDEKMIFEYLHIVALHRVLKLQNGDACEDRFISAECRNHKKTIYL